MTEELRFALALFIIAAIGYLLWKTGALQALARKPTARCADGAYSYSAKPRGTCSHHIGVDEWLPA